MRVATIRNLRCSAIVLACAAAVTVVAGQTGPRQRPPMPAIERPVMFDTPEADRILGALQVFPPDNAWNQDISAMPVHRDSAKMIASIGADKHFDFNLDMAFIIVPPGQKRVPVKILEYPAESDPGPFPVPDNAPIENWPLTKNEDVKALPKPGETLEHLQRVGSGDRHVIRAPAVARMLASASHDGLVKLWNIETGALLKSFDAKAGAATGVSFSSDGRTLAACHLMHPSIASIKLWNRANGKLVSTLETTAGYVRGAVFSPDDRTITAGAGPCSSRPCPHAAEAPD